METITISLVRSLFSHPRSSLCYFSSQVPTEDNLKHCERWKDLCSESLTVTAESKETGGTQDGRRTNTECGTHNHTGARIAGVHMSLTDLMCLPAAHS